MTKTYYSIAELIKDHEMEVTNNGLFHGNTGLSIYFYHLARLTNNSEYEKIADILLDKVFASLDKTATNDFENGLAGIGWGIEYLVQNGFAEGDTDQILEDIDSRIFRVLNETITTSFELANGLSGYLLYLNMRLKKPVNPNSAIQQINRELLMMTINKLDDQVISQFSTITKEISFDLFWRFPIVLYGLAETFKQDIYTEKISCMISQWLPNFEAYMPSLHINRLYLATALCRVNDILPDLRIEKQIRLLLFATNLDVLADEVDPDASNIRYGWPGFLWILYKALDEIPPVYQFYSHLHPFIERFSSKYMGALENVELANKDIKSKYLGLSEGIAGIDLLKILYPKIVSGKIFINISSGDSFPADKFQNNHFEKSQIPAINNLHPILLKKFGMTIGNQLFEKFKQKDFNNIHLPNIKSNIFLRSDSSDIPTFFQIFINDEYNVDFPGIPKVIIDGGANIGLFSILMKNKYPGAKIISIEPDPENFEMLVKNTSDYDNVYTEKAGLWNKFANLKVYDKYGQGKWAMKVEETQEKGNVLAISINDIITKYNIDTIDILKLDIETSEKVVFQDNFENWLPRIKMIIVELHDWLEDGCAQSFFRAVNKSIENYTYFVKGENTIIINNDVNSSK